MIQGRFSKSFLLPCSSSPQPVITIVIRMPKNKTKLEIAAGKLILAIQKEWDKELGDLTAKECEETMYRAHDLLQGTKTGTVIQILNGRSVADFLGVEWVKRHPKVLVYISNFESELDV